MRRVALVTATEARDLDEDLPVLVGALGDLGLGAEPVAWDDRSVAWDRFDAAVVRSAWDYPPRRDEFCAWADAVAAVIPLWNGAEVIRWNTDKRYLLDVVTDGVPVVPTMFVGPADDVPVGDLPDGDLVVKPTVSAGSKDTARHSRVDRPAALDHVRALQAAGRSAMIQPYLDAVDADGETALVYVEGELSHAMRKGPLLVAGAGLVSGLFAEEDMRPRTPVAAERSLADEVMVGVSRRFGRLLYARVDLVPGPDGDPLLLELELCEPSLFLPHAVGAPARLASAIAARLRLRAR